MKLWRRSTPEEGRAKIDAYTEKMADIDKAFGTELKSHIDGKFLDYPDDIYTLGTEGEFMILPLKHEAGQLQVIRFVNLFSMLRVTAEG
jgi:hypothetical protein